MDTKNLEKGTKVYYKGDMANLEGYGKIIEKIDNDYGIMYDVLLDDGRIFKRVMHQAINSEYRFKVIGGKKNNDLC